MSDHLKTPDPQEKQPKPDMPAAGPHAKPELTNPDATPGAGSLPDEKGNSDADAGAG